VTWTFSYVFSAMSAGLLLLGAASSWVRRTEGSFEK
jgi:hypothetical protein